MDFQILYTEPALADLEEILFYSGQRFQALPKLRCRPCEPCRSAQNFPYIGSPVARLAGVRQLVHTPILIYYRVVEDRGLVEVLHFWHAARKRPEL